MEKCIERCTQVAEEEPRKGFRYLYNIGKKNKDIRYLDNVII